MSLYPSKSSTYDKVSLNLFFVGSRIGTLAMVVKHVNRKGQTFYLHETKTKTGKPKYFFSMKDDGDLVETIPEGYEVYENPDAQVFLRKAMPRFITESEIALVRDLLGRHGKNRRCMVDVREHHIVVYHAERGDRYQKVLRFTLMNEDHRTFCAERWCFLGSIDDWIPLPGSGKLATMLDRVVPHIGEESFFELM